MKGRKNQQKKLYEQLKLLSIRDGEIWRIYPEPKQDSRLFKKVPCFLCGIVGRSDCKMCNGKGVYPAFEADLYWPTRRPRPLVVEVQGGIWKKSGHSTGKGIQRDVRKLQLCLLEGIDLLQVTTDDVDSDLAFPIVYELLNRSEGFDMNP